MSSDGWNQEEHPSSKVAQPKEVLLFHDAIDERSLEEWEQGLEEERAAVFQASPRRVHEETHAQAAAEAKDTETQDIGGGPEEGGPPDGTETGMRTHWWGPLLVDRLRRCRARPYRMALVFAIMAASLTSGALVGYLSPSVPRGSAPVPWGLDSDRGPGLRVDGLIIPIDGGQWGLMVSAVVSFSSGHAPSKGLPGGRWLHECLYDAAQAARPQELRGPGGMDLLRIKMVEAITKRHPYLKVVGIVFSEYLVL